MAFAFSWRQGEAVSEVEGDLAWSILVRIVVVSWAEAVEVHERCKRAYHVGILVNGDLDGVCRSSSCTWSKFGAHFCDLLALVLCLPIALLVH